MSVPSEAIELPTDQNVTFAEMVEALVEIRSS